MAKGKEIAGNEKPVAAEIVPIVKVEHKNIFEALSAFQGDLPILDKTATVTIKKKDGGEYSFNYTPLSDIMKAILPLLAKHGLSARHELSEKGVECIVTHETYKRTEEKTAEILKDVGEGAVGLERREFKATVEGELRSGVIKIASGGSDMKDVGGAITYARRYSLTMLLGISSEEDKDAQFEDARKEQAANAMFERVKAGIVKATKLTELDASDKVIRQNLGDIEAGKVPNLGLTEAELVELGILVEKRRKDLGFKPEEAPAVPGENEDRGGKETVQTEAPPKGVKAKTID